MKAFFKFFKGIFSYDHRDFIKNDTSEKLNLLNKEIRNLQKTRDHFEAMWLQS